jgi:hypothetical protein
MMSKASRNAADMSPASGSHTELDRGNGMFEEVPLNMGQQIVPLQEHRRPEAQQDMRLLLG